MGVQLATPRRRRPCGNRPPPHEQGADEITFLDITASTTTVHHPAHRRAHGQPGVHPADCGRWRSVRISAKPNAGADKVSINTAAVFNRTSSARPRTASARNASSSPSTPRRFRTGEPGRWEIFTMAAQAHHLMQWPGKKMKTRAGEILLTSMDQDGEERYTTWASPGHQRSAVHPGDRLRWRRQSAAP